MDAQSVMFDFWGLRLDSVVVASSHSSTDDEYYTQNCGLPEQLSEELILHSDDQFPYSHSVSPLYQQQCYSRGVFVMAGDAESAFIFDALVSS